MSNRGKWCRLWEMAARQRPTHSAQRCECARRWPEIRFVPLISIRGCHRALGLLGLPSSCAPTAFHIRRCYCFALATSSSNCLAPFKENLLIFESQKQVQGSKNKTLKQIKTLLLQIHLNAGGGVRSRSDLNSAAVSVQTSVGFFQWFFARDGKERHTSLDSLGFAGCCCLQSILVDAKYKRRVSSHRVGRRFRLEPASKVVFFVFFFLVRVLKLCSPSVLFFPLPALAKTNA